MRNSGMEPVGGGASGGGGTQRDGAKSHTQQHPTPSFIHIGCVTAIATQSCGGDEIADESRKVVKQMDSVSQSRGWSE